MSMGMAADDARDPGGGEHLVPALAPLPADRIEAPRLLSPLGGRRRRAWRRWCRGTAASRPSGPRFLRRYLPPWLPYPLSSQSRRRLLPILSRWQRVLGSRAVTNTRGQQPVQPRIIFLCKLKSNPQFLFSVPNFHSSIAVHLDFSFSSSQIDCCFCQFLVGAKINLT
jgi:hypothetical protein